MGKIRLDALLVKNGQVQSRERAKALIMAVQVYVKNPKNATKPDRRLTKIQPLRKFAAKL